MSDSGVSPDGSTPSVDEDSQASLETSVPKENVKGFWKDSGFTLDELFKLCLTFYKDYEGKAVHLAYKDKLRLVAYIKQVTHGKVDASKLPPPGYLDVVGNDRRKEWQALGDLSKEDSMREFCQLLDSRCPQVQPYIEAHRREKEEQERKRREEEERLQHEEEEKERQRQEEEQRRLEEERRRLEGEERQREEQQRLQFKEAIYQQLEPQLRPLAAQQYPHNTQQQQVFLQQLQEHYYQQYMQQLQQQQHHQTAQQQQHQHYHHQQQPQQHQQVQHNHSLPPQAAMENQADGVAAENGTAANTLAQDLDHLELGEQGDAAPPNGDINNIPLNSDEEQYPVICKASCWTRKNLKEFKKELSTEKESTIKVGHGETVTVRVPTHQEGKYIFWEFATDGYDIGFGLYFEWTEAESNAISVHVSDSSEEEEEFEEEEGKSDVERGGAKERGPPMDEIIPIYRRDCHQEVYAGSHKYPGRGIYLLKFDNSYSLFRSKTLYYRVYYTRDTQPGRTQDEAQGVES